MSMTNPKQVARLKRQKRIRKTTKGTTQRPRLCVFRSARHIYAQVIDDTSGQTLAAASSMEADVRQRDDFENKVARATHVGQLVGERAQAKGVKQVVFDRNGFLYHGRIKAVSEGARKSGLDF
ncbi:MAG: 50S ribosomal protein L18 [Desulfobacterales bacterium]|nr:50S ribosomal protein L18 [Desulfobacterales bacterium]